MKVTTKLFNHQQPSYYKKRAMQNIQYSKKYKRKIRIVKVYGQAIEGINPVYYICDLCSRGISIFYEDIYHVRYITLVPGNNDGFVANMGRYADIKICKECANSFIKIGILNRIKLLFQNVIEKIYKSYF